jgi:hypothetical protein
VGHGLKADVDGVRVAEPVATLSYAADLGLGHPMEHGMCQTAEALPFEDESFDIVLSTFGVRFAPRHRRCAAAFGGSGVTDDMVEPESGWRVRMGAGLLAHAPMSYERRAAFDRAAEKERAQAERETEQRQSDAAERRGDLLMKRVVPHTIADVLQSASFGQDRHDAGPSILTGQPVSDDLGAPER